MKNTFLHAVNGLIHAVRQEINIKIHLLAATVVIMMGVYFGISSTEWLFIIGCCMWVLSLELLNTAIENICNLVSKDFHPLIKVIKDVAAGAVLVSAIGSAVIGLIIFLPKIIHQIKI